MNPYRTVARGWYESSPYAHPGTWAVIDTSTHVLQHFATPVRSTPSNGFVSRWVVGIWHKSASALSGHIPLGSNGLTLTVLAAADSKTWAMRLVRHYQDDPHSLYTDLWEALPDEFLAYPVDLSKEELPSRLGLIEDRET